MRLSPTSYFTHGVTLAYRTYGHGPLPVLAFHGFGRMGTDFAVLEEALGERCTLYAFDLHFHGQSPAYHHRVEQPFAPQELAGFFAAFADRIGAGRVSLLGFSLGGRIALSLLEQMPERIGHAFLIAPDGLRHRPWYRALVTSRPGRWAYKRIVERPAVLHATIGSLRALRLMGARTHRFLLESTGSRAKRQLVHDVWLSYRLIEPDLAKVATNMRAHGTMGHLFFGARDRVIPPRTGRKLWRHAPDRFTQRVLDSGHRLLGPELGRIIAELLPVAGGG